MTPVRNAAASGPAIQAAPTAMLFISPRSVTTVLVAVLVSVLMLHAGSQYARFAMGMGTLRGLTSRVYLGAEASLPAWFSAALMLVAAQLLFWIARAVRHVGGRHSAYWMSLAGLFVLLSLDEAAAVHEAFSSAFTGLFAWLARGVGGAFEPLVQKSGYHWVAGGALLAGVVAVACLRFLRALPPRTSRGLVIAGAIYVAGAIGFELAGGSYSARAGADNLTFVSLLTIEETLEMVGLIVFIHVLLAYLQAQFDSIQIRLTASP